MRGPTLPDVTMTAADPDVLSGGPLQFGRGARRVAPSRDVLPRIHAPDTDSIKALLACRFQATTGYRRTVLKPVLRKDIHAAGLRLLALLPRQLLPKAPLGGGRWRDPDARVQLQRRIDQRLRIRTLIEHRARLAALLEARSQNTSEAMQALQASSHDAEAGGNPRAAGSCDAAGRLSAAVRAGRGARGPRSLIRTRTLQAVLALLAAGASLGATAQVTRTQEYLERMDTDGDGRVSLAEYQAWMSYAFDRMDRNGDGVLSADELPGGKGRPITRAEHMAKIAATFNRQDTNRDGYLDARELAAPPQR